MSSPCKRIKLTPTKVSTPRYTQETRVSTPKGRFKDVSSLSISNISSKSSRTRLSDVFESDENKQKHSSPQRSFTPSSTTTDVTITGFEGDINYDDYFNKLVRIKHIGTIWDLYKPLNEKSLYGQIVSDPANVQEIVNETLIFYNRHSYGGVHLLIQLCVDACGFQNISVVDIYKFSEDSAKEVVSLLETEKAIDDNKTLKNTSRYLLMESRTKLAEILKMAIYMFLEKFVFMAYSQGILFDNFLKKFFTFVKCMSFSNLRCVRHTGIIFAAKLLTSLVKILNAIINDPNYLQDETLGDQKMMLDKLIEYFYFVFIKNCHLQDNKMILMRVECLQELTIWIKLFPKVFISDLQAFNYLRKLTIDGSKEVRLAALSAYEHILENSVTLVFLKPYKREFTDSIATRFYDVDYQVAVRAINIFTRILRLDYSFLSEQLLQAIINNLIFDNYFPISKAACEFLKAYFESFGYDSQTILIKLASLAILPGSCRPQLLIEGCIDVIPEVQDWNLFTHILLENEKELQVLESLATLLHESVYQTLKGKSSKLREKSRIVAVIDSKFHLKAAKMLSTLNNVIQEFRDSPTIFCDILKICTLINHNLVEENFCKEYTDCLSIINQNFYKGNKLMLHQMLDTLNYLCTVTSFSVRAKRFVEDLCEKATEDFIATLSQPATGDGCVLLRTALLYSKFNMNDKFSWELLFDSWNDVSETETQHLLACCKWYLVWSLRTLTDTLRHFQAKELFEECVLLLRKCNEFVSTCFNMLQHLQGQRLHFEVYKCLCDFYIMFSEELENPIKINKQFEKLCPKLEDKALQNLLALFLEQHIINNPEMALSERRANVVKYVNLVHLNILPVERLGHIFKYYYSHNADYEPIIESSLKEMTKSTDDNAILLVVLSTLTMVYEDILRKHNVIDITTDDARNLKFLVKQFLTFQYFRSPKPHFKKLLYFSVMYVIKDESKYAFLYFIRYFTNLIVDVDDQKEIYEFLKQKLPDGAEKNDAVLFFATHMKNIIKGPEASKEVRVKSKVAIKTKENIENAPKGQKNKASTVTKAKPRKAKEKVKKAQKKTPVKNVKTPVRPRKRINKKKNQRADSETEISGDSLSIYDSETDIEGSMSVLRI